MPALLNIERRRSVYLERDLLASKAARTKPIPAEKILPVASEARRKSLRQSDILAPQRWRFSLGGH
ncbi:hypothetical protein BRAS3809_330007 [Bradyrhizobium sp. STM 3809]|nr:hypothetical protein BRAS3809_330007 [Bradyrhizobium sp. STM 3809]